MDASADPPPSFLLLPVAGPESRANFEKTVRSPVEMSLLRTWLPPEVIDHIELRIVGQLGMWGQGDKPPGMPGETEKPMIWDRIEVGTLALFADSHGYHTMARVIGTAVSAEASSGLWGSDGYKWLIFLTDVRPVSPPIPLSVVIEAAGYKPKYIINRQTIVPKKERESKLWEVVQPYLSAAVGSRRVWWVNQGDNWRAERAGGYLFATEQDTVGREMVHHNSMTEVRVGDRIIHYASGLIRAVSGTTAEAVVADHPDGRTESKGFVVRADYTELTPHVELSAIPEDVRLDAPSNGPFMVNGRTKEGYLWPVAPDLAEEIARACPPIAELLGATTVAKTPVRLTPTSLDIAWLVGKTNWLEDDLLGLIDAVTGLSPQVVLAGPPGTSKTWVAKHVIQFLTQGNSARSKIIQFHPTYGYEEFIEGLRPVADGGAIKFQREDGIVLAYVEEIKKEAEPCFLLIDEMNRANLSRVFGELMYLFEYRDDPVDLRYTKGWKLPANLKFVGTMNTADRSIRSIDIALRRRFDVFECQPDAAILERYYTKETNEVPDLVEGFIELNQQLEATLDRHHTIGHAFFMESPMTAARLRPIWSRKIGPLIEEYFFDQSDIAASFTLSKFWPSVGDAD